GRRCPWGARPAGGAPRRAPDRPAARGAAPPRRREGPTRAVGLQAVQLPQSRWPATRALAAARAPAALGRRAAAGARARGGGAGRRRRGGVRPGGGSRRRPPEGGGPWRERRARLRVSWPVTWRVKWPVNWPVIWSVKRALTASRTRAALGRRA